MALDGLTTEFTTDNLRDLATVDAAGPTPLGTLRQRDRARISGSGWTIVIVGDAAEHLADVEALGLGPVTVVHDA